MHHMGEALDGVQPLHLDGAKGADLAQVVAPQVHQHIVLGQLLLVRQQLRLQRRSSSPVCPLGLVPARGKVWSTPFSSFTSVSGEAPATSTSVPRSRTYRGRG